MRALFCILALAILSGCQPKAAAVANVTLGGSSSALTRLNGLLDDFRLSHGDVDLRTEVWNSATAVQRLRDGSLDIALVSSPLTVTNDLVATPLMTEPIALIVHPTNKVDGLTMDQVSRIFSGRAQNWSEIGGSPGLIQTVSREEGSGTRAVFLSIVLDKSRLANTTRILPSPDGAVNFVAETRGAIGYASLSAISNKVKVVKLDGFPPDSARYKLAQPYLAVTSSQPNLATTTVIEFLSSHLSP